MRRFKEVVEAAFEATPHHGLTLRSGEYLEGYLLDHGDDWLELGEGGPLGSERAAARYTSDQIALIWYSRDGAYVAVPVAEEIPPFGAPVGSR